MKMLRIEIYDPLTDEQVEGVRAELAKFLGCPVEDVKVDRIPLPEEGDIPTEPEPDDWCTRDYRNWWCYEDPGMHTSTDPDNWGPELLAIMEEEGYWPNAWYLGERGDWNLLNVHKQRFWVEGE